MARRTKPKDPVYFCERCKKEGARSVPCAVYNHEKAHLNHMLCGDCIETLGGERKKRYGVIKGNKIERRFMGITPSPIQCPNDSKAAEPDASGTLDAT